MKDIIYTKNDLGITINDDMTATFKTYAPIAKNVQLLLFKDSLQLEIPDKSPITMKHNIKNGIWYINNLDTKGYTYYKYRITNNSEVNDIADIYSYCLSADSVASMITDINKNKKAIPEQNIYDKEYGSKKGYYNPFGLTVKNKMSYTDAFIYEMHIRDWSRAVVKDSTGRYLDIADSDKIMQHLKDLGVTHVQLLPVFDYAETNADTSYNWGYNPYHYNAVEGRYASKGYRDATTPVKELRRLIAAFHENNIAVNMDVVYNHTSGTGKNSLYDMTVPYYYYRTREDKSYYNGSGCGNEINSGRYMVKKYIIQSLKHWMLDYHFNGFRFDLMGVLERDTLKEIYSELYKIDPNVMVYGEPWTGGESAVIDGLTSQSKNLINQCSPNNRINGVACFDDDFRNAIKGAEFGGFETGQVQGNFNDDSIIKGLTGSKEDVEVIGRYINYVECHDNYTLFDKLALSILGDVDEKRNLFSCLSEEQLKEVKKQDILSFAYVILAQGTPFINGGQEFLRSKKGDDNSYVSDDSINQIDLTFRQKYNDVYTAYKALITFRKSNIEYFGSNREAHAISLDKGVTQYTTGPFTVIFNATESDYTIREKGYRYILNLQKESYVREDSASNISNIEAKNFVIFTRVI